VVIGDEVAAAASPGPVAWIRATAMRSEPTMFAGKDHVNPRAGAEAAAALWRQVGITDPLNEIDVAEIYVPFSWYEPMWLENLGFAAPGQGMADDRGGRDRNRRRAAGQPVRRRAQLQPDRGVRPAAVRGGGAAGDGQGGRPLGAGGAYALGHAYGGGSQFFSMWVVSDTKSP
jgi:acetyl-CoA C-acetyltransferase